MMPVPAIAKKAAGTVNRREKTRNAWSSRGIAGHFLGRGHLNTCLASPINALWHGFRHCTLAYSNQAAAEAFPHDERMGK
jgi:hypothetical protein